MEKDFQKELRSSYFENDIKGFHQALASGADPNFCSSDDRYAYTLLCQAVFDGNIEVVRLLLQYGADIVDREMRVSAPLIAVFREDYNILDEFFAIKTLEAIDITLGASNTLVLQAVKKRNFKMVFYLLEHGCNINKRNEEMEGETPLDYAVREDDVEMVRFLLEHGANPLACGLLNYTAFEAAEGSNLKNDSEIKKLLQEFQQKHKHRSGV